MPSSCPSSSKVCVVSLGCPKNLVDSEMMLGLLTREGFKLTTDPSEADAIVINSCAFVEEAKRESIGKILELARYKKEGRCRLLVVGGCLPERYGRALAAEMPEVDLFVGTNKILPDPDLPRIRSTPSHYTYVKISEGCSHLCSFCTIPAIRGGLKSRPIESIVREVKAGVDQGIKEFNLIAQDLNEYGRDLKNGESLTKLLTELDRIRGDFWLRTLYLYPLEFTDRLIGLLRDAEHVVKYVDIPLQHISERILLSMKRGSPSRTVRQLLSRLKKRIPGITLRTTFLVGYPGETGGEFRELCDFVGEYEFDRVGVFKYSREEGTPAAGLSDQVPEEVKGERYDRLMGLQQKISLKKNRGLVGKTFRALCEGAFARLPTQAPEIDGATYLAGGSVPVGEFREIRIVGAREYDLIASLKIPNLGHLRRNGGRRRRVPSFEGDPPGRRPGENGI